MSDLPHGWERTSLASLVSPDGLFSDGDWVESKDQDPNGSIRLLQLADVGDGVFLDKSSRFVNDEQFKRLRCTEVLEEDVLIARMPDPLGRACLAPRLTQRCITVVDVAILRPSNWSVRSGWVMHALNAPQIRTQIELESTGTTRRRIARGKLALLELPVPPVDEQNRLVEKIDTVLALIDSCSERLARVPAILKRFRQSVLAAATSGALTEEWREGRCKPEWDTSTLASCGQVSGGLTKNSKRESLAERKRYLRVANVHANRLDLSDVAEIGLTASEYARTRLRAGDLLIVEGNGSIDHLGRVALWSGELDECVHQNHLIRWRTSGPLPEFVLFWLLSPRGRTDLMKLASTTTGLHTLSISKISAVPIALPSKPEQAEIVRRVESLFTWADRLEARHAAARAQVERLTPSLLAKAFRGELVPQDPADEPASELLMRLTQQPSANPNVPVKRQGPKPHHAKASQAASNVREESSS